MAEPLGIQRAYLERINRLRADMIAAVREHVVPVLEELAAEASRIATTDAKKRDVGDAVDAARAAFEKKWPKPRVEAIVEPIAKEVPTFSAKQLNKQLSAAIGETISLDIVGSEAWVAAAAREWTSENVALIKSIPAEFFPDLEKRLTSAIADGARWEELALDIEARYGVTASRAKLIARDQIGKFNGDLNRVRQTDLGITKFIWRSMGDERVRDDHVERNGQTFEWSDPPEGETPGEPIMCRCFAEAVISLEDE